MEQKLIEGGIYNFGVNEEKAKLVVVIISYDNEVILFDVEKYLTNDMVSNNQIVEKLSRLNVNNPQVRSSENFKKYKYLKLVKLSSWIFRTSFRRCFRMP